MSMAVWVNDWFWHEAVSHEGYSYWRDISSRPKCFCCSLYKHHCDWKYLFLALVQQIYNNGRKSLLSISYHLVSDWFCLSSLPLQHKKKRERWGQFCKRFFCTSPNVICWYQSVISSLTNNKACIILLSLANFFSIFPIYPFNKVVSPERINQST